MKSPPKMVRLADFGLALFPQDPKVMRIAISGRTWTSLTAARDIASDSLAPGKSVASTSGSLTDELRKCNHV